MAFQPLLGTVVVELTVWGQHGLRCDSGPAPVSSLNEPLAADLMKRGWAQHSWLLWPPKPALSPRLPLHPINPFQPLCCTPSGRRGFDPLLGWASTSPEGGLLPSWCFILPYPGLSFQGMARPTRSLSTAQLVQPSGGLQASVISNIVLMKGQAKVSRGCWQQKLPDRHGF